MPSNLQSSENVERRRGGGKGKAKIEKVWDRRLRSSAAVKVWGLFLFSVELEKENAWNVYGWI